MANPFIFGALSGLAGGLGAYGAKQREEEQRRLENQRREEDLTFELLKLGGRPSAGDAAPAGFERINIPIGGQQKGFDVDPLAFGGPSAAIRRRTNMLSGQNIPGMGVISPERAKLFAEAPDLLSLFRRDPGTVAQSAQAGLTTLRTIQDAADNIAEGLYGLEPAAARVAQAAAIANAQKMGINISERDVMAAKTRLNIAMRRNNPLGGLGGGNLFNPLGPTGAGSTTGRPATTPAFSWNPNE